MDILDDSFGPTTAPVDLNEIVGTDLPPLQIPKSSIRNRAATTALLSDQPAKAVDNYQLLMREGEDGQDVVYNQIKDSVLKETQQLDMQGIMSVLGDANISLDEKKRVIGGIKESQFLKDSGTILHTNSLSAGSKGENPEQEDSRISSADAIREIYSARNQIQGLVNAHAASLDNASIGTVGEMASLWVAPFGNTVATGTLNQAIEPQSLWKQVKGYLLPGSTMMDIRERLASIPPEKRVEYAKGIVDAIKGTPGMILSNDNQFAQFEKASAIFEDGGYGSFEAFVDNVSPLLDAVGIGQAARGAARATRATRAGTTAEKVLPATWELVDEVAPTNPFAARIGNPPKQVDVVDQIQRIELNSVVRRENPAAPANVVQSANPEKARSIHDIVVKSSTDEVSEALYGVSKEQAIINDVMPQVSTPTGAVTGKVVDIDRNLRNELGIPDEMIEMMSNTGGIYYTDLEKAQARATVINDFTNVTGITVNDAMSSFTIDGGRIKIGAVYGTSEGGFLRAIDALDQAQFALRSKGVAIEDLELLKREGLDYVPTTLKEVDGIDGSYMVRVNTFHDIDPTDIGKLETFDVKRNLFDRVGPLVSNNTGSVSRYLFDAASMLHPTYTGAASVASDQTAKMEKFLLGVASEYSTPYTKLSKDRKLKVDEYIREANFQGIKFDRADLVARGFQPDEIDVLKKWRNFWDGHFYLENADIVKTLNSQGYQRFKNQNTELFVKPVPKNQNLGGIYDPATDSVITHTKLEGDALYNSGGTYAKLRRPTDFGGVTADHMIVRNTPTEYTRKFRDTDQVLNYREGYFQIQYNSPRFVDEITKDLNGNITGTRTVAVAGDTKEAELFARRAAATNQKEYKVRGDARALRRDDDAWWDINSANGRIAQRHRGKLLEDAAGVNQLGNGSHVLNPVDSAVRAAKSISGRTVNRPMLEAAKARFINQYGEVIPPNGMGGRRWPKNVSEISQKGKETSKLVADARTTYEYINYLENAYINSADNIYKVGMNAMADMLGSLGWSKAERAALTLSSGQGPTSLAKNMTFMAYIGSNVLRQWIIQPHQIIRTVAYNPIGWLNGGVPYLAAGYLGKIMMTGGNQIYSKSGQLLGTIGKNGNVTPHAYNSTTIDKFTKFIQDSGMLDSVDKQNLVRGSLTEAADSTNRAIRFAGQAAAIPRKVGFDIGEMANLIGHAAAVYEKHTRSGLDLSNKTLRDRAYSEIRAISYDMNFAGDMVYNQTLPALALQFIQVPHKAWLQMTNRRIPVDVRMRISAADLLMWGGPTTLIASTLGAGILPDDDYWREVFVWGLESAMLNYMFTTLSGERTNIDFSSLAPYEMTGWTKFFEAMYSGGFSQLITNSPSGQLFFKEGGRVQTAIAAMGRYFGMVEDIDEEPTTFTEVMDEVLKISSGYNNAVKAKIMLDAKKRYDQYGSAIDQEVGHVEAWAQALGFGTGDTRDLYQASMAMSKDVKAHKEETLKVYESIKRYYTEKLEVENSDPVFITKVTGRVMNVFKDDPVAQAIISNQLSIDLQGKDAGLISLFMKRSAIPDIDGLKDQVKRMPVSEEQKTLMMQRIDDVTNMRQQMKDN